MANDFSKQTTTASDPILPMLNVGPAFANVAALPDATKNPGRIVLLYASTVPNAACLAISDGIGWFPISIGATVIS